MTTKNARLALAFLVAATLLLAAAAPIWAAPAAWYAAGDSGRSSLYQQGQRALDESRWADAADLFGQVAKEGGGDTDAALYWQAYALVKRGRDRQALTALAELQEGHRDSSWLDDARALELEIRQRSGQQVSPQQLEDEELKLYAVNSLMNADPERAVPVIEKLLVGNHSVEIQTRALFVLSQSDSARGRAILLETARGSEPELARKAIEYLGLCESCGAELRKLYDHADPRVRGSVLEALMLADDEAGLIEALESETDPALRMKAIEQLGLIEATGDLRRLYETEPSPEVRATIVEALFLADDATTLTQIAKTDPDPRMRGKAIESLGLVDSDASRQALAELYRSEKDPRNKSHILEALFLSDAADLLAEIARSDADPAMRRKAIESLGLVDNDASRRALGELYAAESEASVKGKIIEALFLSEEVAGLAKIAKEDPSASLRRKAIQSLGLVDSDEAAAELSSLYQAFDDRDLRMAILEAYFIQEAARPLIDVLRTEEDSGLRKQALEYLSLMDSEEATDFLVKALDG